MVIFSFFFLSLSFFFLFLISFFSLSLRHSSFHSSPLVELARPITNFPNIINVRFPLSLSPPLSLFLIVSDNKKSKLVIIIMPLISRIESFGSLLRLWREICVVGGGGGEAKRKRKGREGKKQRKRKRKPARVLVRERERESSRAQGEVFRFSLFHPSPFSLSLHRFINGGERVAA